MQTSPYLLETVKVERASFNERQTVMEQRIWLLLIWRGGLFFRSSMSTGLCKNSCFMRCPPGLSSLSLVKGVRGNNLCCPGDGKILTKGTFEGREFCFIVYQESHRFVPKFARVQALRDPIWWSLICPIYSGLIFQEVSPIFPHQNVEPRKNFWQSSQGRVCVAKCRQWLLGTSSVAGSRWEGVR